jgi:uncharacterized cupin superfamily protein
MHEARIDDTPAGRLPADDGWWVLNLGEIAWESAEGNGTFCIFEAPSAPSPVMGIGVHIVGPGEANGLYHAEDTQEGFLVLAGEGVLVVEGQERPLRPWDFFHCPPNTGHVLVAAGDGPFVFIAVGARREGRPILYPVDEAAARYRASVAKETTSRQEAYEAVAAPRPGPAPELPG